ncbi:hypothetical protein G6F50_015239 [Rhizopus delemar]|uniref:Uncharacterized protein n=1 Tax=Rhizopus delemar TaxID=936053 RepID=A0A9P7C493_9FUNG|nr:hypothetical protein G6F50_015239 [Rhizopus delemar]
MRSNATSVLMASQAAYPLLQANGGAGDVVDPGAGDGGGAADGAQAGLRRLCIHAGVDQQPDGALQVIRLLVGVAGLGQDCPAQRLDLAVVQARCAADLLVLAGEAGGVLGRLGQLGHCAAEQGA